MSKFYTFILLIVSFGTLSAQLTITEIMYNPPESGTDSLEYIELYNNSDSPFDLNGVSFSAGVTHSFTPMTMAPRSFVVLCINARAFENVYGTTAIQWDGGALSNSGEALRITNSSGVILDEVVFGTAAPWPGAPEGVTGGGASIVLCDYNADNNIGENWSAAQNLIGVSINGRELRASPGLDNEVSCSVSADYTIEALPSNVFLPQDLTIQVGETVKWVNRGGNHNVNGQNPNNPAFFGNGDPSTDLWEYVFEFSIEGVYSYQSDLFAGAGMTGTITVVGEPPAPIEISITEIYYNDPSADDTLEFVELFNYGREDVNLKDFTTTGISMVFGEVVIPRAGFVVICKDSVAFRNAFGRTAIQWTSGSLNNAGELLGLYAPDGSVISEVNYSDDAPWPTEADLGGHSLSLCQIGSDENNPANWQISTVSTGLVINDIEIFADPYQSARCRWNIGTLRGQDAQAQTLYNGVGVVVRGSVYGVNMRATGLQITIIDDENNGIGLFSATENFGYTVTEGDIIEVVGVVEQFNGLTQIVLEDVRFVSSDNDLFAPTEVQQLSEATESQLVVIRNVQVVNPQAWSNVGGGFNVDVTNGQRTFTLRVDADTDIFGRQAPTGTFDLTGIGGQFDNATPFTEGYQIIPRYSADINPYNEGTNDPYPKRNIPEVTTVNESGVANSLNLKCELQAIVYGINQRPAGIQFALIDDQNNGITVFVASENFGYTVTEGDEVVVRGSITQFNGLTQIAADTIFRVSSGNPLVTPKGVNILAEEDESSLVRISGLLNVVSPSDWLGNGGSFNVRVTDGTTEFILRILAATELSSMQIPQFPLFATGIVTQFDSSNPFTSGYQLLPRYAADLESSNSVSEPAGDLVRIFPNPTVDRIQLVTDRTITRIDIYDQSGRQVTTAKNVDKELSLESFATGVYHLVIEMDGVQVTKTIVKK